MKPKLTTIIVLETFDQAIYNGSEDYRDFKFTPYVTHIAGWLVQETKEYYAVGLEQTAEDHRVRHTISVPKFSVKSMKRYEHVKS